MPIPAAPATRRDDVVDLLHGVAVADPYRWLEDGASEETRVWTAAQNARTDAFLGAVPGRSALEARLTELYRGGTVDSPAIRGRCFFYLKRTGEQSQAVLYAREGGDGLERVLVDPNQVDPNGLTALDWWFPSRDGGLVAYGTSQNGDEWSTLRVVETATGRVLPDAIARTRYSSVAWLPDNSGFFYTRYPAPGTVPPGQEHYNSHAFFHALGTDPRADPKVFGEGRSPQDMLHLETSTDGRWLVAIAAQGWVRTEVFLRDLHAEEPGWSPIAAGLDARFDNPIPTTDRLYLRTNLDAANGRIVAVDPTAPALANWTTVVPARADAVLEQFVLAGDAIVTQELESATSRLNAFSCTGEPLGELPLPTLGTVRGLDGEPGNPVVVASFASFAIPPCAFAFTVATGERTPLAPVAATAGLDATAIDVRQVRYPSKDGTAISMFLVGRKGAPRDGQTPAILSGYGGFNISLTPDFRPFFVDWIERGGLVAVANLRGGGEYGETWHRAGMLGNKQNVFDDFIAAAEWLIGEGYTNPDRLAIFGGSNGGLLVGATMTQRPDLFRAVYYAVPLLDMLRYHHFSIAKLWIPEYGSADDPVAFRWLYAYSPYHHVECGTHYPAVFLTTAEQDSRVEPLHARKMTALLQWAMAVGDDRPILLRTETGAGHGAGKPTAKRVEEAVDLGCFLASQLGINLA
jgi:prolyl oligopeptidase